ncbi:hypothetical protein ACN38_g13259 [Penicillium nordicum]|uniref:Uncharacterized protein n=2 Tax=Penicillium nordicum TaxID=229535 RepID=A0A0M8NVY9_9EURO|nr:hypothetical protein ACN38_g13259 [Penicillium nordicum]
MTKPALSTIWAVMMTKRNIWYIQYSKSHDLYGIIPCKSMYATLHFDTSYYIERYTAYKYYLDYSSKK